MLEWCAGCKRSEDGYRHIKCLNCKWYETTYLEKEKYHWDRFVPKNDAAKHPSSFLTKKENKKPGILDFFQAFTKIFL